MQLNLIVFSPAVAWGYHSDLQELNKAYSVIIIAALQILQTGLTLKNTLGP